MTFDEQKSAIEILYENISELRIIKGKLSTDPTFYEFYIKGMCEGKVSNESKIRVCAEKLDSPREFRKQYQKVMYLPAIRCKNAEWDELLFELIREGSVAKNLAILQNQ